MAAIVTDTTDGQYVQRGYVLANSGAAANPFVSTDTCQAGPEAGAIGPVQMEVADLQFKAIPVNAVANAETVVTGLPGLVAVAWQADDLDADRASCFVSNIGTGEVTILEAETGTIEGYIWCFYRG
jgi:hypothetical protein